MSKAGLRHMENKMKFVYSKNPNVELLFESAAFVQYAPFFFDKPMTIQDVSSDSGISRQTIGDQISKIPEYMEDVPWSPRIKGHPHRLKMQILTHHFSNTLGLDELESKLLDNVLSRQPVQDVIRKNNRDLGTIVSKTVFTILLLENLATLPSQIRDKTSLDFLGTIFSGILNEQPKRITKAKKKYKESGFGQRKEDLQAYKLALVEFCLKSGIFALSKKFRESDFELKASPKGGHLLIQLAMKGKFADQILNSEAKSKVLNWRKHPKTKEGKFIKKLRNQMGKGV